MSTTNCQLRFPDGSRVRVDASGILIGRSVTCHVILQDRRVSKRHALVRVGQTGPELIPLGRHPVDINGHPTRVPTAISWGDRLDFPGLCLYLEGEGQLCASPSCWVISGPSGTMAAAHKRRWSVGGGDDDWLWFEDLPPGAVSFRHLQGDLLAELGANAELNGRPCEAGSVIEVVPGDTFKIAGRSLTLEIQGAATPSTAPAPAETEGAPLGVRFEFLPEGGKLYLDFGTSKVEVQLSEFRARLVAVLLAPRGGLSAGDLVPDELVLRGIWPGQMDKNVTHLNVLLHRVRSDLLSQDVNPFRVLERPRGVASTRFRLSAGAKVVVG